MGNRRRSQRVRGTYAFIKAHRGEFDTAVMCRLLDVSRSGCYQWLRHPPPYLIEHWRISGCWA